MTICNSINNLSNSDLSIRDYDKRGAFEWSFLINMVNTTPFEGTMRHRCFELNATSHVQVHPDQSMLTADVHQLGLAHLLITPKHKTQLRLMGI